MGVEIKIMSEGGLQTHATHGPSRQELRTDAPVDNGGKGELFSPTDLVATALGSCMLTVMDLVATRSGINIKGSQATVVKEMSSHPVRRIGALKVKIELPPHVVLSDSDRIKLERAAHVCPVKASLHPDIELQVEFIHGTP
jgi:putative redox protein